MHRLGEASFFDSVLGASKAKLLNKHLFLRPTSSPILQETSSLKTNPLFRFLTLKFQSHRHMAYNHPSPARDRYGSNSLSGLDLIALPFTSRYTSCSPPRESKRQKLLMLSKKPMELVSITFSHHQSPPTTTTAPLPIQIKTDSGRTIIHQKPGIHLDPSVHGDHPSPPHSPSLEFSPDPVRFPPSIPPVSAPSLLLVSLFSGINTLA